MQCIEFMVLYTSCELGKACSFPKWCSKPKGCTLEGFPHPRSAHYRFCPGGALYPMTFVPLACLTLGLALQSFKPP